MSNGSNKKVTATDVARLAGVSQSSVSRAFSKSSSVSKTKKARILEAAEKLGYQLMPLQGDLLRINQESLELL
ncbi:LacI family DNA-binding transcriptional regulator [Thalassobacillus sp. C254]|uniref:LacI family DNA-binding transcriptional regulator n=1 Tax=Thalassobacillus sp. C254 TaxID=1225341 RepID=UPI000A89A479|nr:LacI family DNA-binding transcriptional regulator [Thalassobacillus sp. C254]